MHDPDGREHLRRVGALLAPRFEHPHGAPTFQQLVSQEHCGAPSPQAVAQCAEHRQVKARIGPVQAQAILPVETGADCLSGLAIGQVLANLHERHEGQPPWGEPHAGNSVAKSSSWQIVPR